MSSPRFANSSLRFRFAASLPLPTTLYMLRCANVVALALRHRRAIARVAMFVVVGCALINAFAALRFTGPATSRKINWKSLSDPSTKHRTEPHVFNSASLMIAIVCDAQSIWTLGPTILDTWLKDSAFDFRFFVGYQADDIPEALEPYTVRALPLPTDTRQGPKFSNCGRPSTTTTNFQAMSGTLRWISTPT